MLQVSGCLETQFRPKVRFRELQSGYVASHVHVGNTYGKMSAERGCCFAWKYPQKLWKHACIWHIRTSCSNRKRNVKTPWPSCWPASLKAVIIDESRGCRLPYLSDSSILISPARITVPCTDIRRPTSPLRSDDTLDLHTEEQEGGLVTRACTNSLTSIMNLHKATNITFHSNLNFWQHISP